MSPGSLRFPQVPRLWWDPLSLCLCRVSTGWEIPEPEPSISREDTEKERWMDLCSRVLTLSYMHYIINHLNIWNFLNLFEIICIQIKNKIHGCFPSNKSSKFKSVWHFISNNRLNKTFVNIFHFARGGKYFICSSKLIGQISFCCSARFLFFYFVKIIFILGNVTIQKAFVL